MKSYSLLSCALTSDSTPRIELRRTDPANGRLAVAVSGVLDEPEQKLLFLLVYLKTYPLQVVMAELFALSQPRVNYWLRRLLPVLREALNDLNVLPERDAQAFARTESARSGTATYH